LSGEVEKPKDYIDLCSGCNQGVTRDNMVYQKGRAFHPECYTEKGTNFQTLIPDLIQESADTKIQLVYLKNLKNRQSGNTSNPSSLTTTKKTVRRSTPKKKKSKRTTKRKTKHKIAKKRKRKSLRRTSPKKARKRSAIRRKAKRFTKKRVKRR